MDKGFPRSASLMWYRESGIISLPELADRPQSRRVELKKSCLGVFVFSKLDIAIAQSAFSQCSGIVVGTESA